MIIFYARQEFAVNSDVIDQWECYERWKCRTKEPGRSGLQNLRASRCRRISR